eukprot:COSAG04_NODE_4729_length_1922_cov_2.206253_1_plen_87_part_10
MLPGAPERSPERPENWQQPGQGARSRLAIGGPDTTGAIYGLALGHAGTVLYLATGSALLSFDVDQVSGGLTKRSECALPVEDFSNFI